MSYAGELISRPSSFLQEWPGLSQKLGVDLSIQRDDLLPFPLAGNKWVKLLGHVNDNSSSPHVFISNGGINSNHCRTIALWAARNGHKAHVVLHGQIDAASPALNILTKLGCSFDVVAVGDIAARIEQVAAGYSAVQYQPIVIAGGGHSVEGVTAYRNYAEDVVRAAQPEYIVHASGTGGTQAGVIAACQVLGEKAQVIGISVARRAERGIAAIEEATSWLDVRPSNIDFRDSYIDGGYGVFTEATRTATEYGWRHGLPLDNVYTGKAFAGMLDLIQNGDIPKGSKVLFWHTGGGYIAFQE